MLYFHSFYNIYLGFERMLMLSRRKIIMTILASILLLLIPIILWSVGWQWSLSNVYTGWDQLLFFVTQTGTAVTYAAIACIILATVLSLLVRKTSWVIIFFTAFILLIATQVIKTGLKSFYKEPRPYTSYLVEKGVNLDEFYDAKRSVRKEIVASVIKDNKEMPEYLKTHWQKETGFSFPSGHVAFAVCWMMIFLLFLPMNRKRDWVIFSGIFIWTALMIISRIRFGMHYPLDVFASTLYVPVVCLAYAKLTQCPKITPYFECLADLPKKLLLKTRR